MRVPFAKRMFDIVLCLATIWLWLPLIIVCALLNFILNGRPVFYPSIRRVHNRTQVPVIKLRAMVRNADKIVNRDTVPVSDKIFLNIPTDSALYTPLGRFFETLWLTELPQLLNVLAGQMSLVGNRPLPENVVAKLRARYPYAEDRFWINAGLTGPSQLVGRDNLSDRERLSLEIKYCKACLESYSVRMDFMILLYTALIGLRLSKKLSMHQVEQLLDRYSASSLTGWWEAYLERQYELVEVFETRLTAAPEPEGQIKTVGTSVHLVRDEEMSGIGQDLSV
jgi:lipopolysaccharide/colanic/teichoic acid biosynthesis glycosyltransferase